MTHSSRWVIGVHIWILEFGTFIASIQTNNESSLSMNHWIEKTPKNRYHCEEFISWNFTILENVKNYIFRDFEPWFWDHSEIRVSFKILTGLLKSNNQKSLFNPRMTILGGHNCVPGERLGSIDEFEGGRGTYIRKGFIYSSRIGKIRFVEINFFIVYKIVKGVRHIIKTHPISKCVSHP